MKQNVKIKALAYFLLSLPVFTIITSMSTETKAITANAALSEDVESRITSLQPLINSLNESANRWNARYIRSLTAALFIGLWTLVCQFSAIQRSRLVSDKQSELLHLKDIKAANDSQEKDRQISETNKLAGLANERAGTANQEAGTANERATRLEAGNLQLRLDLETEQRKNAEAQRAAAEAQLALRRNIEYAATPRRIVMGSRNNDQEVREAKFKELEKYAGTTAIILFVNDGDAKLLAFDIRTALLKSGWKADVAEVPESVPLGYIQSGVQVRTLEKVETAEGQISLSEPPKAKAIVDLLRLDLTEPYGPFTGVTWSPDVIRNGEVMGVTRYGLKFPEGGMVITVGAKPVGDFLITHDLPAQKK